MFGKQNMLWDLGLRPNEDLEDIEKVKQKILTLDKEFDLVMIAEKERHAKLLSINSQSLKIGIITLNTQVCLFVALINGVGGN